MHSRKQKTKKTVQTYVVGVDCNEAEGTTRDKESDGEQSVSSHALVGKDLKADGSQHGAEHHGGEQVAQRKKLLCSTRD